MTTSRVREENAVRQVADCRDFRASRTARWPSPARRKKCLGRQPSTPCRYTGTPPARSCAKRSADRSRMRRPPTF